ncbi:MAG TPA: hypothetical protein VF017_09170 [Thermoanaerobaculia bacterium]|nr:hypothetical protein [Thermoanaerobaculia bacterium]
MSSLDPTSEAVPAAVSDAIQKTILDHLVLKAGEIADKRIVEREDRRRKSVTMALALIGLVGAGGIYALIDRAVDVQLEGRISTFAREQGEARQTLQEDVQRQLSRERERFEQRLDSWNHLATEKLQAQNQRIEGLGPALSSKVETETGRIVSDRVERLQGTVSDEVAYMSLTNYAVGLDLQASFSAAERDAAMGLVRRLARTEIPRRTDFATVLGKIVKSFHAASQFDQIDELDQIVGDVMGASTDIIQTLVDHYGQRVLGAATEVDATSAVYAKFRRYLERAGVTGYPEIEALWLLLLAERGGEDANFTTNREVLKAVELMDDNDRVFFMAKLVEYSVPRYWARGRRSFVAEQLAKLCKGVRARYPRELKAIFDTLPSEEFQERLATAMAANELEQETVEEVLTVLAELAGEPVEEGP